MKSHVHTHVSHVRSDLLFFLVSDHVDEAQEHKQVRENQKDRNRATSRSVHSAETVLPNWLWGVAAFDSGILVVCSHLENVLVDKSLPEPEPCVLETLEVLAFFDSVGLEKGLIGTGEFNGGGVTWDVEHHLVRVLLVAGGVLVEKNSKTDVGIESIWVDPAIV